MPRTHYDTLKVSRDAPIEVIRAAYRVLSQKYHPDRHPADSVAAATMTLLNEAYEVLSDPRRRQAHDAWIRQTEAESSHLRSARTTASRPTHFDPEQEIVSEAASLSPVGLHLRRRGILYGSALLVSVSLVVVVSVAHEPQMNWSVAVPPAPEDRYAYIREAAREFVSRRSDSGKDSAAPAAPQTAAPPSDKSSPSATEGETPAKHAEIRHQNDAPRANDPARPAQYSTEEARPMPTLFSFSPPNEPEFPSVSPLNLETLDSASSSFEPRPAAKEAVVGTE